MSDYNSVIIYVRCYWGRHNKNIQVLSIVDDEEKRGQLRKNFFFHYDKIKLVVK